jgi:hypothetical protein
MRGLGVIEGVAFFMFASLARGLQVCFWN